MPSRVWRLSGSPSLEHVEYSDSHIPQGEIGRSEVVHSKSSNREPDDLVSVFPLGTRQNTAALHRKPAQYPCLQGSRECGFTLIGVLQVMLERALLCA